MHDAIERAVLELQSLHDAQRHMAGEAAMPDVAVLHLSWETAEAPPGPATFSDAEVAEADVLAMASAGFAERDRGGKRRQPIRDDPFWTAEAHPLLAARANAIRRRLQAAGWTPCIPKGSGFRTRSEQMRKLLAGYSKTLRSQHCVVDSRGRPQARAVDIVPAWWGWEAPREFWLLLGRLAEAEGLIWGGFWGLTEPERARLRHAYRLSAWEQKGLVVRVGWDPAHVELPR